MANYWLLKTEPTEFSYPDLECAGRAVWDGVTNPLALKHLRAMRPGDLVFVYHTGKDKQIVGVAKITREAYPDPQADDPKLVVVELAPQQLLAKPVTLTQVKADPEFAEFELVRQARLSVMPVSAAHWKRLLAMAS